MSSLTTIAADIRTHSPGVLPESLRIDHDGTLCFIQHGRADNGSTDLVSNWYTPLPDDIAADVLIAAMVKSHDAFWMARCPSIAGWEVRHLLNDCSYEWEGFADDDHGGTLGACYAAWKWAKGLT